MKVNGGSVTDALPCNCGNLPSFDNHWHAVSKNSDSFDFSKL